MGLLTVTELLARLRARGFAWWQRLLAIPPDLAWEGWWQDRVLEREGSVRPPREVAGSSITDMAGLAVDTPWVAKPLDAAVEIPGREGRAQGRDNLVWERVLEPTHPGEARSDADLVAELQGRIEREPWVSDRHIWIDAKDGMIALTGLVADAEERAALGALARAIVGCKGVENHLLPREAVPVDRLPEEV